MAFKNGLSERLDELRFPSSRSPPSESSFPGYGPFSPGRSNVVSAFSRPPGDVRSNMQRRFTTDSGKFSPWNYLNQGALPMPDPLDMMSSVSLAFLMNCFAGPFLSLQIRLDLFVVAVQIFRLPIRHTVPVVVYPLTCFLAGQPLLQVPACELLP